MTFPKYRSVVELTDDEIAGLLKNVDPSIGVDEPTSTYVEKIIRYENSVDIKCVVCVKSEEDENIWIDDWFLLDDYEGLTSYNYELKSDEILMTQQYLLACGCHYLLKDNPFL